MKIIDMTKLPQEWRDILADIQQVAPGAIIAGGALRDFAMDKAPKDIDIFVPESDLYTVGVPRFVDIERLFSVVRNHRPRESAKANFDYIGGVSDVSTSTEFTDWVHSSRQRIPVNIIIAKATKLDLEWARRFDFTVNQIIFDGEVTSMTVEALHDLGNKVFRYVREGGEEDAGRSRRRAERFRMKYPDWTFIVPEDPLINEFEDILGE
jgi:tRNA nucleotidyltransferase/poly(A) polymerase